MQFSFTFKLQNKPKSIITKVLYFDTNYTALNIKKSLN